MITVFIVSIGLHVHKFLLYDMYPLKTITGISALSRWTLAEAKCDNIIDVTTVEARVFMEVVASVVP